jgi:hypothetical protein
MVDGRWSPFPKANTRPALVTLRLVLQFAPVGERLGIDRASERQNSIEVVDFVLEQF